MRRWLLAILFLGISSAHADCPHPWVFFDLGNTIVDTKTHNYNPIFYMRDVAKYEDGALYKNAKDYLDALRARGFKLGMLIDVPESWGPGYPAADPIRDPATAKIVRLMDFIKGINPEDKSSWKDDVEMDWAPFGKFSGSGAEQKFVGTLLLPRSNAERKGSGSRVLFERARALAEAAGCKAIYMGEDAKEMRLAEESGLVAFQVGITDPKHFYLPIGQLSEYVETYSVGRWKDCGPTLSGGP